MATIAELEILLKARGFTKTKSQLNNMQRLVGRIQRSIAAFAAVLVFRKLAQGLGQIIKATGELSRGMADVSRTTGLAQKDLTQLQSSFIELSTVMAGTVQDFVNVGIAAGRAGLKSRQEIEFLAQTAAIFGKIARISFDKAANAFIGLSVAFGASDIRQNVADISIALIEIAKKFRPSEKQLIEGFERMGAAVSSLQLDLSKTTALLGGLIAVTGRARRAGTQLNRAFIELTKGTEKMNKVAVLLDTSFDDIAQRLDTDVSQVMIDIIKKLSTMESVTARTIQAFRIFGGVGLKAIGPLLTQIDKIERSILEVNEAIEGGTSDIEGYIKVMESTGEQLELVQAGFKALQTAIGVKFEEAIRVSAKALISFFNTLRKRVAESKFDLIDFAKSFVLAIGTAIIRVDEFLKGFNRVKKAAEDTPQAGGLIGFFTKAFNVGLKFAGVTKEVAKETGNFETRTKELKTALEEMFTTLNLGEDLRDILEANRKEVVKLANEIEKRFTGDRAEEIGLAAALEIQAEEEKISQLRALRDAFREEQTFKQFAAVTAESEAFQFAIENQKNAIFSLGEVFSSLTSGISSGFADIFNQMIRGTLNAKKAFTELGFTMIKIIVDYITQFIVANTIGAALAALAVKFAAASAATLAAAWLEPAALASIATLGGAVTAGITALGAGLAAAAGLSAGFSAVTGGGAPTGGIESTDIPQLASGGIVRKPTLAMIGEAGPEAVVPLNRGGGAMGNITVNMTEPVFFDDESAKDRFLRELEDAIVRASTRKIGATDILL